MPGLADEGIEVCVGKFNSSIVFKFKSEVLVFLENSNFLIIALIVASLCF